MTSGGQNWGVEILLVDDSPADITQTIDALRKSNIRNRVHVLRDGNDTLDFLLGAGIYAARPKLPADTLILLSMSLANTHGLDVLRKIKSDERTRTLSVILLIASHAERGVMASYKLGANACVVKPVDFAKLSEAIPELRLGWLLVAEESSKA